MFLSQEAKMNLTKLSESHWRWVEGLLSSLKLSPEQALLSIGYVYKTAFAHGVKHAQEQSVQDDAESGCVCGYSGGGKCNLPVGGCCTSSVLRMN